MEKVFGTQPAAADGQKRYQQMQAAAAVHG
jgi:hypothetical protein